MEVHSTLGHGFLEVVYKDAIEWEMQQRNIMYQREKEFPVFYKGARLQHKFFADFVLFDKIIVEIKSAENGISNEWLARVINYLKASGCKIGLLINFGKSKLEFRRVIL